jgi:murein DD-endopeptidase MepM/ murein hydrolase activator NlpD
MKFPFPVFPGFFGRVFHKRSIIIISEHKTNHLALSGALQFGAMMAVIACVVWASYSTGRYMATRSVLEERDETIKSVANSRIDTNFSYMVSNLQPQKLGPVASAYSVPLTDPAYTLSAVNHDKLFARIAMLENKVRELKNTNTEIIQTVREKAHNKILTMEDVIRQTGLSPDTLKEQAARERKLKNREAGQSKPVPQGGPFISADATNSQVGSFSQELQGRVDQYTLLSDILRTMPLGLPMAKAEHQSSFGRRIDPFNGRLAFHAGMDLSGPAGTKVSVTGDGTVVAAGWNGAYGNAVDVDHGLGLMTRYGHLSQVLVSSGDKVKKGQFVGVQGSTGRSTGPHLHYEVRYNGRPVNPNTFVNVKYHVSQVSE